MRMVHTSGILSRDWGFGLELEIEIQTSFRIGDGDWDLDLGLDPISFSNPQVSICTDFPSPSPIPNFRLQQATFKKERPAFSYQILFFSTVYSKMSKNCRKKTPN